MDRIYRCQLGFDDLFAGDDSPTHFCNYPLVEGGSFTGAIVGMACQDLSVQDCAAGFDYFHYIERD